MNFFNQYQYNDLLSRDADIYAQTKYKIILSYLKNRKNLKILNAGCGSGELSFLLATAGHNIMGIDPSEEYISLAKKNLPAGLENICAFEIGVIDDLVGSEVYDCVVATDVLEHIRDDARAIKKLAGLVKVGGDLIITVPAMPILFGFHDERLGHYRRYTSRSLRCLAESIDCLPIKRFRYFCFTLIPIAFIYSKILRRPYPVSSGGNSGGKLFRNAILKILLYFDCHIPLPLGTSLIFWAQKR